MSTLKPLVNLQTMRMHKRDDDNPTTRLVVVNMTKHSLLDNEATTDFIIILFSFQFLNLTFNNVYMYLNVIFNSAM
jgi:hypothetical protein